MKGGAVVYTDSGAKAAGPNKDAGGKKSASGADAGKAGADPKKGPEQGLGSSGKLADALGSKGAPKAQDGDEKPAPQVEAKKLDTASAKKILQDAYGADKEFVEGAIQVLAQADFQAAYDKIYGAGPYSWDAYVKPTFGNLNGFAYDGTNYINKETAGLHTVVHEMLHLNTAADWTNVVGSEFNEGTTDWMTVAACKKANEPAPICYPQQNEIVTLLIKDGLSEANLTKAYLNGGAQKLVADWFDSTHEGTWAELKTDMQAKDFAKATEKANKKKGGG